MWFPLQYLLDHEAFTREAAPLVDLADAGDHEAVYHRAREIAANLRGRWILEEFAGEWIGRLEVVQPGPERTGLCFLVILSQYLRYIKVPLVIDYVWQGLKLIGWTETELTRMLQGMHLVTLLKPEWLPDPYEVSSELRAKWASGGSMQSPAAYPWYFRPVYSFYAYWRTWQQSEEGWQRLQAAREEFLRLDYTTLGVKRNEPSRERIMLGTTSVYNIPGENWPQLLYAAIPCLPTTTCSRMRRHYYRPDYYGQRLAPFSCLLRRHPAHFRHLFLHADVPSAIRSPVTGRHTGRI